jgi:hypothetical protein
MSRDTSPILHGEFSRRAMRRPGVERVIAGMTWKGSRYLQTFLLEDGRPRNGSQIRAETVPLIKRAIESVRASRAGDVGRFEDGRFTVDVRTGRHPSDGTSIFFQRRDANGHEAGRENSLYGDEIEALEAGCNWLME